MKRATIAGQKVVLLKPKIDNRYSEDEVVSHQGNSLQAMVVERSNDIKIDAGVDVIAIDEAQFFDSGLVQKCQELANKGVRVIVAGLDMDFTGKPFGPVPDLLATAEYVSKVHAICVSCGNLAQYSHRKPGVKGEQVVVGATEKYEPLCRTCFNKTK